MSHSAWSRRSGRPSFRLRYSSASAKARRIDASTPIRVFGKRLPLFPEKLDCLGFSPSANFTPRGAPGNRRSRAPYFSLMIAFWPPIALALPCSTFAVVTPPARLRQTSTRSEEHTSELQSQSNLVCRLLLEKKKKKRHAA